MKTTVVVFDVKIKVNIPCGEPEAIPSFIKNMGENIIKDALEQEDCENQDCEVLEIKVGK